MKTRVPSYIKLSDQQHGQMAYGHIDPKQTDDNINDFIQSNFANQPPTGFIRVQYTDRSYDDIRTVSSADLPKKITPTSGFRCDALITSDPAVVLALPVADCIALVVFDPIKRVLALAHLGWQATADSLAKKLISQILADYGSSPDNLLVYLSPHIRKENYHFPAPISQQSNPAWNDFLTEDDEGEVHIDLTGFNVKALMDSGVAEQSIIVADENTADPATPFNSHFLYNKTHTAGSAERFLVAAKMPEPTA